MGILVRLEDEEGDSEIPSWGIIELQGDMKTRNMSSHLSQFVGDLHFSNETNPIPILIVGHHLLHGKVVKLEKPFAVLKQVREGTDIYYVVAAIVRQKLLFKIRPKPIIPSGSPS